MGENHEKTNYIGRGLIDVSYPSVVAGAWTRVEGRYIHFQCSKNELAM